MNRWFGARKGVSSADMDVNSANKGVLAPLSPQTLPSTACEVGARKGATSVDKVWFGANKVLAPRFLTVFTMNCLFVA